MRSLREARAAFHSTDAIHRLRTDFVLHPLWRMGPPLPAVSLIEAMVSRLAELSLPRIPQDVFDQASATGRPTASLPENQ